MGGREQVRSERAASGLDITVYCRELQRRGCESGSRATRRNYRLTRPRYEYEDQRYRGRYLHGLQKVWIVGVVARGAGLLEQQHGVRGIIIGRCFLTLIIIPIPLK